MDDKEIAALSSAGAIGTGLSYYLLKKRKEKQKKDELAQYGIKSNSSEEKNKKINSKDNKSEIYADTSSNLSDFADFFSNKIKSKNLK